MNKHLARTSKTPFEIDVDYAEGVKIYDRSGKSYFDLISGISVTNLGHGNARVKEAIHEQVEKYLHVMVYGEYKQAPQQLLANKLANVLPESLNCSFFVNSGAEANEAALKLAKRITGRSKIVAFNKSYHGATHGALSVTGNEMKKYAFRPLLPDVHFIDFNDIDQLSEIDQRTAAVIVEPIQGDAGVRIPTKEFMVELRKICDKTGAQLIFDEIQTGFGRTGKLFAFEHYNVLPDILTLAKGMGGGMPIGAFISSHEKMEFLTEDPILGHITTFGGHPVNCASALANLEEIIDNRIVDEVETKGKIFEEIIEQPGIIEIRRIGLFFAIELQNPELVQDVVLGCKDKGVLSFWFLSCPESFRIAPPLNISEADIRVSAGIIHEVIKAVINK